MLEKIIKKIKSYSASIILAGALILNSACSNGPSSPHQYIPQQITPTENIPTSEIQIEESFVKLERYEQEKDIDYSVMDYQEVIERIDELDEVQKYLDENMTYFQDNRGRCESFRANHEDGVGVCIDYAVIAAALLSDNVEGNMINSDGQLVQCVTMMYTGDGRGHAVYVVETSEGYCALGNTPVLEPADTIEELILTIGRMTGLDYTTYQLAPLDVLAPDEEWIHGELFGYRWKTPLIPKFNVSDES